MKKKTAIIAALIAFAAFSAFAEMGMYIKGALGYGFRTRPWNSDYFSENIAWGEYGNYFEQGLITVYSESFETLSHLFVLVPTFGIEPWRGNANEFLRGLSFEFSLDLGIGLADIEYNDVKIDDGLAIGINPRIMAVYTYRSGIIAPYGGIGISVPIIIIPKFDKSPYNYAYHHSEENTRWSLDTPIVKAGFNVNFLAGIGFMVTEKVQPVIEVDFGVGTGLRVDARAGVVYRFGL